MTELEHVLKKHSSHLIAICNAAHIAKYNHTCDGKYCKECDLCANVNEILKILLAEHKEKPKLTDDEKAILRNIDNTFKYIAKDEDGELFVFEKKPIKNDSYWDCGVLNNCINLSIFTKLFKSIKWEDEEPWSIKELLEE